MEFLTEKSYVTVADVEKVLGYLKTDTNVTEASIKEAIKSASDEVDLITHTRYWVINDSGTVSTGGTTTLTDTTKSEDWTADKWANCVVWIYGGTGAGQFARIASNTTTVITFHTDDELDTATDNTSKYRILPDVMEVRKYDGDNKRFKYLPLYPIRNLVYLEIDDTEVTPSKVYIYEDVGRIELHSKLSPEYSIFNKNYPQNTTIKWTYGVYPIPSSIKRLTCGIAAIKSLVVQMGGTYRTLSTYSIPHFSGSTGQAYINIKGTIDEMIKETNELIKRVKKYPQVV